MKSRLANPIGPLIGPLVMAGVAISEDKLSELKKLGVRDSKLILPARREILYDKIIELADSYHIVETSAREIDQRKAVGTNLNRLEALKAAEIITKLAPQKVILDSPEPTAEKFGTIVSEHLGETDIEIISEHKADMNYVVVAAASILAKVTRDRRVEDIKKIAGVDFGSGYPSDPRCKKFLDEHFEGKIAEYIRKCWAPYQLAKEAREQTSLAEF